MIKKEFENQSKENHPLPPSPLSTKKRDRNIDCEDEDDEKDDDIASIKEVLEDGAATVVSKKMEKSRKGGNPAMNAITVKSWSFREADQKLNR